MSQSMHKVRYLNLTIAEKAYIAGFFDGEGYVAYKANGFTMSFAQKPPEVLWWIQSRIGGHMYPKTLPSVGWTLNIHGLNAAILLRQLLPFLIVKRRAACEAAMKFWKLRKMRYWQWPPKNTPERRRRMKLYKMDRHKLTKEQREEVRRLYVPGKTSHRGLAKMFKVAPSLIGRLCRDLATMSSTDARWHYHRQRKLHHPQEEE